MDAPTEFERFLVGQSFVNAHTDALDGVGITSISVTTFRVTFHLDTAADARKVAKTLGLEFSEETRAGYLNLDAWDALGPDEWIHYRLDVQVTGRVTGGTR